MTIREFQDLIARTYGGRDSARGRGGTFLWFTEEVGELAEALRLGDVAMMREEFADVAAWLVSLANLAGVDLESAVAAKYGGGCSRCGEIPCRCEDPSADID